MTPPKHECPCCGFLTIVGAPQSYEICSVCGWEDDPLQFREPDSEGGANTVSLNKARENFDAVGMADPGPQRT